VYATAISIVKNPADAEEVAQEAVLKAFSKLATFRGESKFSTWLIQITYNEAKMKLRKARPNLYESIDDTQQNEDGEFWPKDYADWRPIPSELLEENEIRQAVQDAISSLRCQLSRSSDLERCSAFEHQGNHDHPRSLRRKREDAASSSEIVIERQAGSRNRRLLD
jgi:RNA polymerase sigma factor (sigma-70 family)